MPPASAGQRTISGARSLLSGATGRRLNGCLRMPRLQERRRVVPRVDRGGSLALHSLHGRLRHLQHSILNVEKRSAEYRVTSLMCRQRLCGSVESHIALRSAAVPLLECSTTMAE